MSRKTHINKLLGRYLSTVLVVLFFVSGSALALMALPGAGTDIREITITEDGFVPDSIKIAQGERIRFVNKSDMPSWPASNPHPTHEFLGGFDPLRELNSGDSWEFTFVVPGDWAYHDHLLPHRRGSITVKGQSLTGKLRSLFLLNPHRSVAPLEQSDAIPPELVQLLAEKDRAVQAKIVRAMAEKYGPSQALDYMARSGLPFTGETHLLVHEIGDVAYERYGEEALSYCNESFLSACYHGVILNMLAERGMQGVAKTIGHCKEAGIHVFTQCSHAAGHGFLASEDYRVLSALPLCDQLGAIDPSIPVFNCYDGVFMENIFGVHEGKPSPNRMVRPDDPYYPCNAVPEKYRGGCWSNQATLMAELFRGDLRKVAQHCDAVKNSEYQRICYDNFARQIHPVTKGKTDRAIELCDNATGAWKTTCLITLINAAFSVGDRKDMPYEICSYLSAQKSGSTDLCYQNLFGVIGSYATDDHGLREFCSFVREDERRTECLRHFQLSGDSDASAPLFGGASRALDIASSEDVSKFKEVLEQKGAWEAYASLKEQWAANPVAAHDLAHMVGHFAAEELGTQGFAVCDENFSFGCYHGLLEELVRQKGGAVIQDARDSCNALSPQGRVASCIHGIGHGILAWKNSKILPALDVCTEFSPQEKTYCADGVFMEYYTGIMQKGGIVREIGSKDTWGFCLAMPEQFQSQCVRNHAFSLLYKGGDVAPTIRACAELAGGLKDSCVRSVGLFATQSSRGSADAARRICNIFEDSDAHTLCISSAAREFIFERLPESSAHALCNTLAKVPKEQCKQGIAEMITLYR